MPARGCSVLRQRLKFAVVSGGRRFDVESERAQWRKLKTGDRVRVTGKLVLNPSDPENFLYTIRDAKIRDDTSE